FQGALVVRHGGERRLQRLQRALGATGFEFEYTHHALQARRDAVALQQRGGFVGGLGRTALAADQVGDQAAQRDRIGLVLELLAEGLLGECVVALGDVGETERIAHRDVVRRGLRGRDKIASARSASPRRSITMPSIAATSGFSGAMRAASLAARSASARSPRDSASWPWMM